MRGVPAFAIRPCHSRRRRVAAASEARGVTAASARWGLLVMAMAGCGAPPPTAPSPVAEAPTPREPPSEPPPAHECSDDGWVVGDDGIHPVARAWVALPAGGDARAGGVGEPAGQVDVAILDVELDGGAA